LLSFLVAGGAFLYSFLGNYRRVTATPVSAWSVDHRADCGVVLTGGPNRIPDAFQQLYLGRIKKLIISGVYSKTSLNDLFPQRFYFGSLNVNDIILERRSLTTFGNAQQSLTLIEALNCRDVVLMTSRLHMYRAYKTFRHYFPKEVPIYKRSTVGKRYEHSLVMSSVETLKAVFYDLWMY